MYGNINEKDNIITQLNNAIDDLIMNDYDPITLYVGGGSALSLLSKNFRPTSDIDIAKSLKSHDIRKILIKYRINDNMATSLDPNIRDYIGDVTKVSELIFEKDGFKVYALWIESMLVMNSVISDEPKHVKDRKYYMTKEIDSVSIERFEKAFKVMKVWVERNGESEPALGYALDMIDQFRKIKGG